MQRQTGKMSGVGPVSMVLLIVLIIVTMVPLISQRIGMMMIVIISMVYFISILTPLCNLSKKFQSAVVLSLLYIVYEVVYVFLRISSNSMTGINNTIKAFLCLLYILPIYDRITKKQKRVIEAAIYFSVLFSIIYNIFLYIQWGPNRYVLLFRGEFGEESKLSAMNTQYISAVLFFAGACLCCFYQEKNRVRKVIYLASVILCIYFLFVIAQRGIMLILAIVMIPLLHLYRKDNHSRRDFLFLIVVVLLFFAVAYADTILEFLQNHISSSRLQSRVLQLRVFLSNGLNGYSNDSFTVRLQLIGKSWSTFTASFSNILFGVGNHMETNQIIGNHSRIVDNLARYGIVGNLLFYVAVHKCFHAALLMSGIEKRSALYYQFIILSVFIIARAFLGEVITPVFGMIIFIFIPSVFSDYSEK